MIRCHKRIMVIVAGRSQWERRLRKSLGVLSFIGAIAPDAEPKVYLWSCAIQSHP